MKRFGKYRAVKSQCRAGHTHDSKLESFRCDELYEMQQSGEITDLVVWPKFWFVIDGRQVKHDNGRRCGVTLDFGYYLLDGKHICEDVKPVSKAAISRDWPLRKAIFKALFPGVELRETQPSRSSRTFKKNH